MGEINQKFQQKWHCFEKIIEKLWFSLALKTWKIFNPALDSKPQPGNLPAFCGHSRLNQSAEHLFPLKPFKHSNKKKRIWKNVQNKISKFFDGMFWIFAAVVRYHWWNAIQHVAKPGDGPILFHWKEKRIFQLTLIFLTAKQYSSQNCRRPLLQS